MSEMRIEWVQGWEPAAWDEHHAIESEDGTDREEWTTRRTSPKPVHAVEAAMEDEELVLAERTACGRVATTDLEAYLPLDPFANTPHPDRCVTCEALIVRARAGQPAGIPRMTVR